MPGLSGACAICRNFDRQGQRQGQRDDERRSVAEARALDANRPSVEFQDLRDDRQTDPESRDVTGRPVRLTVQLEDVGREVGV